MSFRIHTEVDPLIANFADYKVHADAIEEHLQDIAPPDASPDVDIVVRSFSDTILIHSSLGHFAPLANRLGMGPQVHSRFAHGKSNLQKADGRNMFYVDLNIGSHAASGKDISRTLRHELQHVVDSIFGIDTAEKERLLEQSVVVREGLMQLQQQLDAVVPTSLMIPGFLGLVGVFGDVIAHTESLVSLPLRVLQGAVYSRLFIAMFDRTFSLTSAGIAERTITEEIDAKIYRANIFEIHALEAEGRNGGNLVACDLHTLDRVPKPKTFKRAPSHYVGPAY